jgi:hypothetical protein
MLEFAPIQACARSKSDVPMQEIRNEKRGRTKIRQKPADWTPPHAPVLAKQYQSLSSEQ